MKILISTLFAAGILLLSGCGDNDSNPMLKAEEGEELSGGTTTIFDDSPEAFTQQVPGLSSDDGLLFFVGNSFFNQNWVAAPSSTTARDGLGPMFNARSCSGCHFKDGRGRPPEFTGEMSHGLLVRLSVAGDHGDMVPDVVYGDQLQDQAIPGVMNEGGFEILYTEEKGEYPDGTPYSLRKPLYKLMGMNYGEIAASVKISPRVAPQMIGMGLLEAITEEQLREWSDPQDLDHDGISGRPNYVWDMEAAAMRVGRFGWKANQPNILQQAAGAFLGDMGITSWLFPEQNCDDEHCSSQDNGGEPEIENDDLAKVALYSRTLAVPARRNWDDQEVLHGKKLFNDIGCAACHKAKVVTGEHPIAALAYQTIRPYTDLLLHDMGEGLADDRPDHEATGREWRTPPLWGIGLFRTVNNHTYYLHDGRARNLEEAILWHGGEAEEVKTSFMALNKEERDQIIEFLQSL